MPGIYLHIPFCKQACHYCDFHFSTTLNQRSAMIASLKKEIEIRKGYLGASKISTIYFGGGTPSLLSGEEVDELMSEIRKYFEVEVGAEITLEANPDDLSDDKLEEFKQTGINRLSIGIQSFSDEDLRFMNRAHDSKQALEVVGKGQKHGFENLTIDLIYGTPTMNDNQWKANLDRAFSLGVSHLSCYSLTVEPRTPLAKMIKDKKIPGVDDEKSARHFEILMDKAEKAGFEHYEISNFAKDKKYSVHNTSYWSGDSYLGIGPSAHSYDTESRQWNVSNNSIYIRSLMENKIPFEREVLSEKEKFNEYVMTSLRTMWGLDLHKMKNDFGNLFSDQFNEKVTQLVTSGYMELKKEHGVLTQKGKFYADKFASELFE